MSNFSFARSGRLYMAVQSVIGTAVSLSGSNCCRHTSVKMTPSAPRAARNDKTGTLSRTPGIGGFRIGGVEVTMDLAGNGAAGVKPDCDPLLQSWFGQAPVVTAATSVAYNLADAYIPVTMGHFRLPSTVQQQIAWGTVISQMDFSAMDGVVSKWKANGSAVWVPDSTTFSSLDSGGKAGLMIGAFTEPGSPVTNGGVVSSFQGSVTLDGNSVATMKSASLSLRRAVTPQRSYGSAYVTGWGLGVRDVMLKMDLWDDDSSVMTDLLQHGIVDTTFDATLVMGNVAGNTWTWTIKGLQITPPSLEDGSGDRWVASFGDMTATSASIGATNEVSLVIT